MTWHNFVSANSKYTHDPNTYCVQMLETSLDHDRFSSHDMNTRHCHSNTVGFKMVKTCQVIEWFRNKMVGLVTWLVFK